LTAAPAVRIEVGPDIESTAEVRDGLGNEMRDIDD
jgi:hypothetical protein